MAREMVKVLVDAQESVLLVGDQSIMAERGFEPRDWSPAHPGLPLFQGLSSGHGPLSMPLSGPRKNRVRPPGSFRASQSLRRQVIYQ